MPDREAIRCLKQGDIGGLESLIARHQVRAVRAAYFIVQDEQLAEDVVQDTFLRIYRRIQRFDESKPFEPYLMRSVVNAALNVVRRQARESSLDGDGAEERLDTLLARAASVEDQAEAAEMQREILAAVAALPARQRAVVVQRYYLEMSEAEMASALQAPPGTVKWLLSAARARLRSLLGYERSAR